MLGDQKASAETAEPARRDAARLLAAGAALHLLAAASVYAVGRFRILPGVVSAAGVLRGDGDGYLEKSVALGRDLSGLFGRDEQIHVRLYAISSALLTPLVGPNILSLELVSLALYLLTLLLTYRVGRVCFGARAGLAAAAIAGLLPSLVLHQTQPLRDPLFIVLMLTLLWIVVRLLGDRVNFARAAAYAAGGSLTLLIVWLVRDNLWMVYAGIVALGLAALCAASLKGGGRARLPNFACLLLLLAALFLIPGTFSAFVPPKVPMTGEQKLALENFKARQIEAGQSGIFLKVSVMRQGFIIQYPEAGSNIDAGRNFSSPGELIAYLPRAVLVGLFAPFPARWLEEGAMLGRLGRLVSGAETCLVYLLSLAALAGVWRSRREARAWFLLAVVLLGAAALGLVVVNLGALYRMRYFFWIVLMILAAGGLPRSPGFKSAPDLVARLRGHIA